MSSPTIYAELLTNIRQLSVAVTLPSPADRSTQGVVASDGATLTIAHAGSQTHFSLPGKVVAPRNGVLPSPHPGSLILSWRLPLSETSALTARGPLDEPVPWAATDLLAESAVRCRSCEEVVVSEGKVREWKDLPSENWAEMMDFWHCHKPTDHEHGEEPEHLAKRGYGANSSIAAQNGVGLVDLTSLLFTEADCSGLVFSSSSFEAGSDTSSAVLAGEADPPPRMLYVFGRGCKNHIGFFNVAISSVMLFKWQVSCRTASSGVPPSSSDCLAATLIATMSRSGSSKSVVVPTFSSSQSTGDGDESKSPSLYLWIMNGNITYASSQREGKWPAIKLLYKEITQQEADSMLETLTSDVQEVNLPTAEIARATEVLRDSNGLLPQSERVFKEFSVGLLRKWQAGDGS
ncbi:snf2 family helicase [Colletotrichum karsti]|uniref:Snf2 family helicase n=1 Tax=Colletotrichum karsti TaxID=1095194 RepID=A0A9P6IC62_9PEZI|nr:snf2 family helicase [Colletotrichum karsti]KAF9879116.1 snf2 family helicase [Colletotrichum karsti]